MNHKVGIYPNPFSGGEWNTSSHPLFRRISRSLEDNSWSVAGIELEDLLNPKSLTESEIQILHMNWTESLTEYFITNGKKNLYYRLLYSQYYRFLPENLILSRIKRRIDRWFAQLSSEQIPIIFEIHELYSYGLSSFPILYSVDLYLKEQMYKNAKGIIIHEQSCLPFILKQYSREKPYVVAPLGDYAEFHGPIREKTEARQSLGLNQSGRVLGYVGTVRPNRNPANVIRSFLKYGKANDRLIIAGQGMDIYANQSKDPRIVTYSGLLSNEKIRDIICASDFIVNDAQKYMTSAIIRTALSYHTPVIVNPYGAAEDMAQGAAIYIQDDDEPVDDAIERALTMNIEEYTTLVQSAKERNAERTWDRTGKNLVNFFEKMS
ncbi:glycosyltransferase family protein [Methanosphaerula palustris]|uniref:Glycosyl transferase group 1 n=1 Tax=Methanosphaerula palustris (strain ATCC BAA-1556 / DSM 19958 / E1-9c) TaxID=521011 RepID=B8GDY1_METPE|nr:glycosyltransferase [Methanosphaerula palustris]ACL17482.1 glycosyl transferase group 1 [Methanosphaerula palustris E1-9c]